MKSEKLEEYSCPHCRKPIYDQDALLCLYCGKSLRRSVGFLGAMKYLRPKAIIVALVVLVVVSFIILMIF